MFKKKVVILYCIIIIVFFSACSNNFNDKGNISTYSEDIKTSENSNSFESNTKPSGSSFPNAVTAETNSDFSLSTISELSENSNIEDGSKVSKETNESKSADNLSEGSLDEKDIIRLIKLKRNEIEDFLGKDYKILEKGAEESFTAYEYDKFDISIYYVMNDTVDDTTDDYVDFIECGKSINIFGVHIGMTYKDIKRVFPNATLKKWSPEEDEEIVYYQIEYSKDDMLFRLSIKDENSPTISMEIYSK